MEVTEVRTEMWVVVDGVGRGDWGGGGQRAPLCVLIPFIVGALVSEDLIWRQICQ